MIQHPPSGSPLVVRAHALVPIHVILIALVIVRLLSSCAWSVDT